ncbi:Flp pilus assembly protein TadG [Bradyrhizobium sp. USDA 4503]
MTSFFRCRSGASAVEFALMLPLFLAFIFGIIVFGSYLAMVHGVQQLAAEAARSSIAGMTDTERKQPRDELCHRQRVDLSIARSRQSHGQCRAVSIECQRLRRDGQLQRGRQLHLQAALRPRPGEHHRPLRGDSVRGILG